MMIAYFDFRFLLDWARILMSLSIELFNALIVFSLISNRVAQARSFVNISHAFMMISFRFSKCFSVRSKIFIISLNWSITNSCLDIYSCVILRTSLNEHFFSCNVKSAIVDLMTVTKLIDDNIATTFKEGLKRNNQLRWRCSRMKMWKQRKMSERVNEIALNKWDECTRV